MVGNALLTWGVAPLTSWSQGPFFYLQAPADVTHRSSDADTPAGGADCDVMEKNAPKASTQYPIVVQIAS